MTSFISNRNLALWATGVTVFAAWQMTHPQGIVAAQVAKLALPWFLEKAVVGVISASLAAIVPVLAYGIVASVFCAYIGFTMIHSPSYRK